ncbi:MULTISPECIES: hypothetical protein [unclassified Arthrobacter]|uniref:hypothetical protein n=1 Tax=unclassified Arthrobacter TaxID=235627 RepID=UPI001D15DBBE|nr:MULTISPECIES: hypothetical protein [unclassified Arthrobacter]MCC3291712.1 hypothetical protein [Arthrobacter sp. zg-Y1110]MCC3302088.1 hypothetical protein [Arthrobacter sp. zg-Y895]UWX85554.1 hypothetical protein N2K99_03070 [Arthrobacter sp. zg-Y1110]
MSTPSNYNYNAFSGGQPAAPPAAPERPAAVERGFWLLIASAVVSLIAGILSIVTLMSDEGRSELARVSGLSSAEADTAVTIGIVTGVVIGVISVAVSVLFAVFARKGHNWARIVITVFAALSLFGLVGINGSLEGILSLVSILLIVAAVVLFFTAPATAYFNQMKQYRQAKSLGYAG